ncbi:hypothetical protein PybrP1_004065, partial [[Pythium] brassicae (nom. inval.)]
QEKIVLEAEVVKMPQDKDFSEAKLLLESGAPVVCAEARENAQLVSSVFERVIESRTVFVAIARSRHVLMQLERMRRDLDGIERDLVLADTEARGATKVQDAAFATDGGAASGGGAGSDYGNDNDDSESVSSVAREKHWRELVAIRDAQLAFALQETRDLSDVLPDRHAEVEALTLLQYELAMLAVEVNAGSTSDYDDDGPKKSKDTLNSLFMDALSREDTTKTLPALRRLDDARSHSHSSADAIVDAMRVGDAGRSTHQNARSQRRRRRRNESATNAMSSDSVGGSDSQERRLRVLSPNGSTLEFSSWVRGHRAEIRWQVLDKSVEYVRIVLRNVGWRAPTTLAMRVPNDGLYEWRRVYWGLPIVDGYYVNIYDATNPDQVDDEAKLPLLAQSEHFAVVS